MGFIHGYNFVVLLPLLHTLQKIVRFLCWCVPKFKVMTNVKSQIRQTLTVHYKKVNAKICLILAPCISKRAIFKSVSHTWQTCFWCTHAIVWHLLLILKCQIIYSGWHKTDFKSIFLLYSMNLCKNSLLLKVNIPL